MKLRIVLAILLTAGCARERPEDVLAKLDALKQEQYGDIARQEGECRAVAIEFRGDPLMVKNCQDTYRLVVANAQRTIADIDKRITELRKAECTKILAKVKANGGGFVPLDCE